MIKKKSFYQAHEYYSKRLKLYSTGFVKEITYDKSYQTIIDGFEEIADGQTAVISTMTEECEPKKSKGRVKKEDTSAAKIREDSLSRTRNSLIDYALENADEWLSFVTLTFARNEEDVSIANKQFDNWTRSIRRVYPDFRYLGTVEFQKRGAVHYHILTNIKPGGDLIPERTPIKTYNPKKGKTYELKYYDLKYWRQGYSSAEDLSAYDDKFNAGLYICKYLYKDIDMRLFGRNKILKSNNLRKPDVIKLSISNPAYNYAYNYIVEHGYDMTEVTLQSDDPFMPSQYIVDSRVPAEDIELMRQAMAEFID